MILSENTLSILKNFSTINTSLRFKKGNVISTINQGKSILASATIDEEIPQDFGIYELNQLLSIISLYKKSPKLSLNGNDLCISGTDGKSTITYRCCSPELIKNNVPDKEPSLPTTDIEFNLSEDDFNWIMRTASVLSNPNISVSRESNGKVYVSSLDCSNDSAHTDTLEVDTNSGTPVKFFFKTENWKMVPGPYKVSISSHGVSLFENTNRKVHYWVALDSQN